ncbi:MAG: fimbrial assembly protein [Zetaproteobacteria bacterium]|nr:MAG: fimbrial assembly protein [Zetaproteobacteria bacterium]
MRSPWLALFVGAVAGSLISASMVWGGAAQHLTKAPTIDFEHLRDPFASPLRAMPIAPTKLDHPRQPLEAFDLATLKLVAVYRMGDQRVAMVEDSGGTGYVVREGGYIGLRGGRVVGITDDSLIIQEPSLSPSGRRVMRRVVLTLKEVNEAEPQP